MLKTIGCGRRSAVLIGWVVGLAVPLMVLQASSWGVVVASNMFLGLQQVGTHGVPVRVAWGIELFVHYQPQSTVGMYG